ncbi:MAG: ABC transporter substrate-binding protein [Actinomycetaceae bacterium]|nr:ABC transporter substrate-binding protein [Actinomycetaceae bacterium]
MITRPFIRATTVGSLATAALVLAACGTTSSLEGESASSSAAGQSGSSQTLVIGSQDYYSNEIIAQAYALALEDAGYTVQRDLRIGQREVYMPELQAGKIDVFPEYTGNLLQYLDAKATQRTADEVHAALGKTMPKGLRVLDQAQASDQDSFVVTSDFAKQHNLKTIGDLAKVKDITLGGNSELKTRPYGPDGLKSTYDVTVNFTPIEDSGGALTVDALRRGQVQLVDIYSANPALASDDLVVLEDPKGLLLASHVVPVVSDRVDEGAVEVINKVSAAMDAKDLQLMNQRSEKEGTPAETIAKDWLASEKLLGGGSGASSGAPASGASTSQSAPAQSR